MRLLDKYKAPTPWKFRIIGDTAIAVIPVITLTVREISCLDSDTKSMIAGILSLLLVTLKFYTNFHTIDNQTTNNDKR